MMITEGEVVGVPREKLKESFLFERPHAFIQPKASIDELLQNVLANHIHFIYGNCMERLINVCDILGIKAIAF